MNETQCLCVKCLAGAYLEAVLHKLHIFARGCSSQHLVATISRVVKQWMSDMFHVNTYLVSATGFQLASHHCYMRKVFKHGVMCYSRLAHIAFGENGHLQSGVETSAYVAFHSAVFVVECSPHQGYVLSFCCFVEKLFAKRCFCIGCFCHL